MSGVTRRAYRVSLVTALALVLGYSLNIDLPYIAPLFAFILALGSEQPISAKGMVGLLIVISITLGTGLLLIPVLQHYPITGMLMVLIGMFVSTHLTVNMGQALVGTFFMMGMTLITVAGTMGFELALVMLDSILVSVICAVVCQWLVFPFFAVEAMQKEAPRDTGANLGDAGYWVALRTTAIVFPVYFLALTNPSLYIPIIMKAVSLGQQSTEMDLQKAGDELLLSTLAGGVFAILFWALLKIQPNLWVFFLLTLLFTLVITRRLFGLVKSKFKPSFWQNSLITLLILIGPAVQDTANGKDVYKAFTVRVSLFVAVSLYAWFAAKIFERWRSRRIQRKVSIPL